MAPSVMAQYSQARPWMLLEEGGSNTYVSSAMPQKRNPGPLNRTRRDASTALSPAMRVRVQAHNITPGARPWSNIKELVATTPDSWEPSSRPRPAAP